MILEVSDDKEFLRIINCTTQEYNQVKLSFVKKTKNYKYSPLFKRGLWDGNISFYKGNLIPSGMYDYLKSEMSKIGSCVKISGFDRLINKELTEDGFNEWCDIFFDGTNWNPRDYQRNAAYRILKMKHCLAQLATSAGKTLISFMVFAYLLDNKLVDKILMVVPNIGLVVQGSGDFMEYNTDKLPLKIQQMYAGAKYDDNTNIIIGTYQTLVKQSKDFFSQFQCCFVDECLHPDTMITMADGSLKKICNVKIGELVITTNTNTMCQEIHPVEYVYKNLSKNQQMYEIEMEDGRVIKITGNHKVLLTNGEWKRVDELTTEDDIKSFDDIIDYRQLFDSMFNNKILLNVITKEKYFKSHYPEIYHDIMSYTDYGDTFSFRQKVYHYIKYDKTLTLGKCKYCGNRCNFISLPKGYYNCCSLSCACISRK